MALTLETVVKQLTDSGIIAAGKLESFIPPKAQPKDGEALLRELHKQNLLTKFQAQQVAAGKVKALILGNYTILDRIGAGGMGQVFKAHHRRMERVVAIKMLPAALLKDAAAAARFHREVVAASKLLHPNIVSAFDADEAGGVHFLVMEYVEGNDLSVLVKKDGPLPVGKAVNYILQAAKGLEFAHGEGVVHRDIKPANLLLDKKGVVKILDMGLARIASDGPQTELTTSGTIMGTVDFMSPEQALNTKSADHRADIYSLGITLYYLLSGKMAYSGESAMEKLMAHQIQPIPSLQDVQTTVTKPLDAVFHKMVAKKMEDRYQSMGEVIEALEELGFGSATVRQGEAASTKALTPEQKKLLAQEAKKKSHKPLTDVVASEKTKFLLVKILGGSFGTIIAPILVFYFIRYLEKKDEPAKPPAAAAPAENSSRPSPLAGEGPGVRGPASANDPSTAQPSASAKPWNTPAFQAWIKGVQALPAGQQVGAVSKKLMELNPGFDGKLRPKLEQGFISGLEFTSDNVIDISPVRTFAGLKSLSVRANNTNECIFGDLSPLLGMKLTELNCQGTKVFDMSPLAGMPLTALIISFTQVTDLTLLKDLPLASLEFGGTRVSDLSPLKGMSSLTRLACGSTSVSDLSPLAECKALNFLKVTSTKVTPAAVAALQKALPSCKIEWDGPSKVGPSPQPVPPGVTAIPLEALTFTGHRYLLVESPGTWDEAKAKAEALGGHLAALTSKEERDWVTENVWLKRKNLAESDACFLGGASSDGKAWSWVTGEPLDMTLWAGRKGPDDPDPKDMILVWAKSGHWDDRKGGKATKGTHFVIEWDTLGTSPVATKGAVAAPAVRWPLAPSKPEDIQRLLDMQAEVTLRSGPQAEIKVAMPQQLPTGPATIVGVVLGGAGQKANDAALDFIARMTDLESLNFRPGMKHDVTPTGVLKLAVLTQLRRLDLYALGTLGTRGASNLLESLPHLEFIHLPFGIADEWAAAVATRPSITEVDAYRSDLTDAGLAKLEKMPQLKSLHLVDNGKLTQAAIDRFAAAVPGCRIVHGPAGQPIKTIEPRMPPAGAKPWESPAFQAWMKDVQAMPAEQQIEAVSKKLMELNPGFDGKVTSPDGKYTPKIENGVVTGFWFSNANVTDISPVRALVGLTNLSMSDCKQLTDLSPLAGMKLSSLLFSRTQVADLSPLRDMPINRLTCGGTKVSDLSPLKGSSLGGLYCDDTLVSDLSSLHECKKLTVLQVKKTKVTSAGVAALQKALPNCKIDWGDPAKR